jgi:peptidoglycan/LPS O-acetylase OafA/YrhL
MHSLARPRYDYVDLIRGFSALTVLIVHYRWFYAVQVDAWPELSSVTLPFESLLRPIYAHGNIAVQMFWLLSGFVFAVAYAGEGRGVRVGDFAVARLARLYSLHIATLLYLVAIQSASMALYGSWTVYGNNDAPHFLAQLFLASNWFTLEGSFNGPIWSVSIEILVYGVFVAYLKIFGSRPIVAAGLALSFFLAERITKAPIAMCGALFFGGVVMAPIADRLHRELGKAMLPAAIGVAIFAITVTGIAMATIGSRTQILVIYGVLPPILMTFIAMDKTLPALPRHFHWIGAITFSLYLIHMPLLITTRVIFPEIPVEVLSGPVMLPAFALTAVGLSVLSYRHFERPLQNAIRRLAEHHRFQTS